MSMIEYRTIRSRIVFEPIALDGSIVQSVLDGGWQTKNSKRNRPSCKQLLLSFSKTSGAMRTTLLDVKRQHDIF